MFLAYTSISFKDLKGEVEERNTRPIAVITFNISYYCRKSEIFATHFKFGLDSYFN